jgi:hypothetical protein
MSDPANTFDKRKKSVPQPKLAHIPIKVSGNNVVTGVNHYQNQFFDSKKVTSSVSRNHRAVTKSSKKGVLLLSNYRPKDFGNSQITLTVDGGQHLRSPGDPAPKMNRKGIFTDPVFDHKTAIRKFDEVSRTKAIKDIKSSMKKMDKELKNPKNYKKFFWTKDMDTYAFGTEKMFKKIELET